MSTDPDMPVKGQRVQVAGISPLVNGEYEVTDVQNGTYSLRPVAPPEPPDPEARVRQGWVSVYGPATLEEVASNPEKYRYDYPFARAVLALIEDRNQHAAEVARLRAELERRSELPTDEAPSWEGDLLERAYVAEATAARLRGELDEARAKVEVEAERVWQRLVTAEAEVARLTAEIEAMREDADLRSGEYHCDKCGTRFGIFGDSTGSDDDFIADEHFAQEVAYHQSGECNPEVGRLRAEIERLAEERAAHAALASERGEALTIAHSELARLTARLTARAEAAERGKARVVEAMEGLAARYQRNAVMEPWVRHMRAAEAIRGALRSATEGDSTPETNGERS